MPHHRGSTLPTARSGFAGVGIDYPPQPGRAWRRWRRGVLSAYVNPAGTVSHRLTFTSTLKREPYERNVLTFTSTFSVRADVGSSQKVEFKSAFSSDSGFLATGRYRE